MPPPETETARPDLRDHARGDDDVACALDADLRIVWTNEAWRRFGAENGGRDPDAWIGRPYVAAIRPPLDAWYAERLEGALHGAEPWSHEYLCPSPEVERRFHLLAYPSADGLLLVHSLAVEEPHAAGPDVGPEALDRHYRDEGGTAHQCMHCRRTRRMDVDERWDWIPSWVAESPPRTSHGLCATCLEFYYPAP